MYAKFLRLKVVVLPILLVGMLQMSGCTSFKRTLPPPPPGGTYGSTSAGANFTQSVAVTGNKEGQNIALLPLKHAFRSRQNTQLIYIAAGAYGVVRSDNGGQSWTVMSTPLFTAFDVVLLNNGVLVVSGTNPQGQGLVIRSNDQGKSWETTLTIPVPVAKKGLMFFGSSNTVSSVVLSIEADPFHPDRIYAGSSLGTVLVGEQSAKTWRTYQTISTDYGSSTNQQNLGVRDIVVSPNTDGEILALLYDGSLIRLTAKDQTFITILKDLRPKKDSYDYVDTSSRKRVYSVSYVPGFPDSLFAGVDDGAVVSRDQGKTWAQLPLPIDKTQKFNNAAVAISPTNSSRLIIAINSVILRSEDGGNNWNTMDLGLADHIISSILIDAQNPSNVLLVTVPVSS